MLSSGSLRLLASNVARLARPSVASVSTSSAMRDHYDHHHHKSAVQVAKETRATLNDLPVPAGSWQEDYNKRNASYNIILASGIVVLIATFALMKQSGALYLHGKPDLKKVQIDPK